MMNNLELVQEAAMGLPVDDAIALDFAPMMAAVYPASGGWFVAIAGDELHYHFPCMAEALDFACAEGRMAQA